MKPRQLDRRNARNRRALVEAMEGRRLLSGDPALLRIDAGGPAYTDASGNLWAPDSSAKVSGGGANSDAFPVIGTSDAKLFTNRRVGDFSYNLPLPAGPYSLQLLFAEPYYGPGRRVFNVTANGQPLLTRFDIAAAAGVHTALTRILPVTVTGNSLKLAFTSVAGHALLSALAVLPATPTPVPTPGPTPSPTPSPTAAVIFPAADAYTRDGAYAGQNFGSATQLLVKGAVSGGGYVRNAYLKFDLTSAAPIRSAVLRLQGAEVPAANDPAVPVGVYGASGAAGSNWVENAITFANAPVAAATPLATLKVSGTAPRIYSFDVSAYLKQQQALGSHLVTLVLKGTTHTSTTVAFDSRESGAGGPQLLLNGAAPSPGPTPAPAPIPGPLSAIQDGSFEQTDGQTAAGWETASADASGEPAHLTFRADSGATDGTTAAVFNFGNTTANAVLYQSFATVPGQTYSVAFDFGNHSPADGAASPQQLLAQVFDGIGPVLSPGTGATGPAPLAQVVANADVGSEASAATAAVFANGRTRFTFTAVSYTSTLQFIDHEQRGSVAPAGDNADGAAADGTSVDDSDGVLDNVTVLPAGATAFPSTITWRTGAPSPTARAEAVGTAVDGKLYVFGGFGNDGSVHGTIPLQSRCDAYDPATNTWTRLADFPEPFTHSQAAVWGSDVWFAGGYIGDHPGPGSTHVWVYHVATDTWSRGPDLPDARGAGASAIVGHTLYFAGGMDGSRLTDEAAVYALDLQDPAAGWARVADMPNARNHVAAASLDGYLYVLGGQHGQEDAEVPQSEVDRYDPTNNTWAKGASLPVALAHITAASLAYDGRLVVAGGEGSYGAFQSAVYAYNPLTDRWSQLGSLPAARGAVVAGIINGQLVASTGNAPTSPASAETWIGTFA